MKLLKKYDDYLLDIIVESTKQGLPLIFSDRFLNVVMNINHPISETIQSNNNTPGHKNTFIDLDDSGPDKVSFIASSKAKDIIKKDYEEKGGGDDDVTYINIKYNNAETYSKLLTNNRTVTTIGRLINKLFPQKFEGGGKPGEDIQSFVDKFKSLRDVKDLELVEEYDIVKYYHGDRYLENKGTLGTSCMMDEDCQEFIEFYAINSDVVSLLVMFHEDEDGEKKVRARALVWKLSKPEDRYFMDRVYTIYPHDTERFIQYARDNNWLYKESQNSSEHEYIYDPSSEISSIKTLVVSGVENHDYYPYMDTLKYFSIDDGELTNDEDYLSGEVYKLEDTRGGYDEIERGHWSDYYGEYIDIENGDVVYCDLGDDYRFIDDAVYLDYYDEWATESYVNNYLEECDYYDGSSPYRKTYDYVTLYGGDEKSCREYAENNLFYSEYHGEFLSDDDAVWSDYHGTYIYSGESVIVYLNETQSREDWRIDDESDGNWWEWEHDGDKYDDDVTEEELREYHDLDEDE